jgi:hypothetical protein
MDISYVSVPFLAWVSCGSLKLLVNFIRYGKECIDRIGYGGFPSTHTAIITSICFLIGFKESIQASTFGLSLACAILFVIDALSLRNRVEQHAKQINEINRKFEIQNYSLREKIGHNYFEVFGGLMVGFFVSYTVYLNQNFFFI